MNISGKLILPVRRSRIDLYRQLMQIDRPAVHADIVFLHQKNLTFFSDILLLRHDPVRRGAQIDAGVIRALALSAFFSLRR